jgi:hypothetical protein
VSLKNSLSYVLRALTSLRSHQQCTIALSHLLSDEHELDTKLTIAVPAPRTNDLASDLVLVHPDLPVCVVVHAVPIVTE